MAKKYSSKTQISFLIASWFGFGFAPKASGTVGSLGALPLCWLAYEFGGFFGILITSALVFLMGWLSTAQVVKYTEEDPSVVVIDEVIGQLLAFLLLPMLGIKTLSIEMMLGGFLLFRFFDITKMWPASFFDKKMHNALGVMMDDVVAGLYAAIVLFLICFHFM